MFLLSSSNWIFPFEDINILVIVSPKYVKLLFKTIGSETASSWSLKFCIWVSGSPSTFTITFVSINVVHPLPDITPELSGGVSVHSVPVPKTFSLPVVWPKSYFVLSAESGLNSKFLPLYSVTVLAAGVNVCTIPGKVLGADVITGVRVLSISNLLCGKLFFSTK